MLEVVDENGKKTRYLFTRFPLIKKGSIKIGKWLILLAREDRPASKVIQSSHSPEINRKSVGNRKMSEEERKYRAMTLRERQAVKWALSLEKDSEALKIIKKLS